MLPGSRLRAGRCAQALSALCSDDRLTPQIDAASRWLLPSLTSLTARAMGALMWISTGGAMLAGAAAAAWY